MFEDEGKRNKMKKIVVAMLLCFTTYILSDEIDLDKKEGTDQDVISLLDPSPASITVDENHTIKATFEIELQPKPISMQEIKLTKLEEEPKSSGRGSFYNRNSKNRTINGRISYSTDKKSILFKADNPLEVGYYEVEFRRLIPKPTMPMNYQRIKTIKYRFYVPEVINGHMLPPEPDVEKNSATLEGIDRNNNGVRDDVERKIYHNYPIKLEAVLLMYEAKAFQKILSSSLDNAKELEKGISKTTDCETYLMDFDKEIDSGRFKSIGYLEEIIFNNPRRVRHYLDYNLALSGGSYSSKPSDWARKSCSQEIVKVLEEMGL